MNRAVADYVIIIKLNYRYDRGNILDKGTHAVGVRVIDEIVHCIRAINKLLLALIAAVQRRERRKGS